MAADWVVALVGAVAGAIAAESARAIATLIQDRRTKPSASGDFLIVDDSGLAVGAIDIFVQNRSEWYLRPREVKIAGKKDGYIHSWRPEDSPPLEPHHVTRVSIPPGRFIEAASKLGLRGEVQVVIDFYDGHTSKFELEYDPEFFRELCGTFPPRATDADLGGNHASRYRAAAKKRAQQAQP
jgi:hypothetical protein